MITTPGEQLTVTRGELDRARAQLLPQDFAALGELRTPGATFSLLRPLIIPGSEVVDVMQQNITEQLNERSDEWVRAGVKESKYVGITFFDGELAAAPHALDNSINKMVLAIKLCNALPGSVTRPVIPIMEKMGTTKQATTRLRRFLWLGMATSSALAEVHAAEETVHRLSGTTQAHPAERVHGNLAYVYRNPRQENMNMTGLVDCANQSIPNGHKVEFERLRLFVHRPGESPYRKLRK